MFLDLKWTNVLPYNKITRSFALLLLLYWMGNALLPPGGKSISGSVAHKVQTVQYSTCINRVELYTVLHDAAFYGGRTRNMLNVLLKHYRGN